MTDFTPFASLIGGALIGCAAVLLMAANGRIAGISGIVSALLPPAAREDCLPKVTFVAGLIISPILYQLAAGETVVQTVSSNLVLMGPGQGTCGPSPLHTGNQYRRVLL